VHEDRAAGLLDLDRPQRLPRLPGQDLRRNLGLLVAVPARAVAIEVPALVGVPRAVNPFRTATRTWNSAT